MTISKDLIFSHVAQRPCLVPKIKFFHPSHRIFRHIHGVLDIDKNKNQLHSLRVNYETNLLSLIMP